MLNRVNLRMHYKTLWTTHNQGLSWRCWLYKCPLGMRQFWSDKALLYVHNCRDMYQYWLTLSISDDPILLSFMTSPNSRHLLLQLILGLGPQSPTLNSLFFKTLSTPFPILLNVCRKKWQLHSNDLQWLFPCPQLLLLMGNLWCIFINTHISTHHYCWMSLWHFLWSSQSSSGHFQSLPSPNLFSSIYLVDPWWKQQFQGFHHGSTR